MNLKRITAVLLVALPLRAGARAQAADAIGEIQNQSTDTIVANPVSIFSDRAALWPVYDIKNANTENQTLTETYNDVPGFQARQNGSPTLAIRGSSSADRVLRLYEGIPINLGDGLGGSELFLPEEQIGSIRAIKGAGSVFYGSSAMAGAVDHRTRVFERPSLRLSYSDFNGHIGARSLFGVAPFSHAQLSAFYRRDPGSRDHSASETSRATALADFARDGLHVKPVLLIAHAIGETPGSLQAPAISSYDNLGVLSGVELSKPVSENNRFGFRLSDVRQWGVFDRNTAIESSSLSTRSTLSLDDDAQVSPFLLMRTFLDLRLDHLQASYLGASGFDQSKLEAGEILEWAISPELSLQPGLRYRSDAGEFIKTLGLVRSDAGGKQWLTYSEGFREASLSDRFAKVSYFQGNPSLQPEKSGSLETGFTYTENHVFTLGSSLFLTRYENLFDTVSLSPEVSSKINSGRATASGAELNASYELGRETLAASYAYLDSKNDSSSEPLRLAPRHQIAMSLAHTDRNWTTEIKTTHWSAFYDRDTTNNALRELPSWITWDLCVRSVHLANWEITGGILNIFDRPRELTIGYPEPQRRFYASALHAW